MPLYPNYRWTTPLYPNYRWTTPLTEVQIESLKAGNTSNGPSEVIPGPIGPMLRLVCSLNTNEIFHNTVHYCGGDEHQWMREDQFFISYPEYDPTPKMIVDMELDEIHLAEEIMEGLCHDR